MLTRCATCTSTDRCPIPPDGPVNARVYCYGERPGGSEEQAMREAIDTGVFPKHLCFIGAAGAEFNDNYLDLAGLHRDNVRVGNVVLCGASMNRKPTTNEALACAAHHIPKELAEGNPEVVILMGATACKLIGGVDLEAEHGIPRLAEIFGWYGWVVPMYHPAAGLHDTAMMIPMLDDWEVLERWLRTGEWQWAVDDTTKNYGLIETRTEIEDFLHPYALDPTSIILAGGDTEAHDRKPYSWQVSFEDNVARMIMLANENACKVLASWLGFKAKQNQLVLVFHNAPADLPIFEEQLRNGLVWCSVDKLDGLYRDTMQEAYGFGGLFGRLGLKVLSRRLLGRSRLSWEETVTPYSKEVLYQWIMSGFVYAEDYWQIITPRFHKRSGKPLKPAIERSEAEKLLPRLLDLSFKNSDYPIWQKLSERMPSAELEHLIEALGPIPCKGIAHCPIDVQIDYACSDPDDTRQLAVMFEQMRQDYVRGLNVQASDMDH